MSKVIFKLTFKHPNFKSTKSKNVAHLKYIATRPGVDKTVTESDLIKELEKGIEAIRETQTILHDDESNNDKYLKYIDERPKSHGLFGQEGAEDINKVQEELSKCDSFVWRGIISLREEDAKALGYLSKDKWQDFLRKKMPDVTDHSLVSYIVVKRNRLGKKTGFITFQKLNEPTKEKDNSGNIVHKNILRPISVRWL